jgi:hypothetical protein
MTLGSWNPADGSESLAYRIEPALLNHCAGFASQNDWQDISGWVQAHLPADAPQMMKLNASQWQPVLQGLDTSTLLNLVQFFTVVEQQLPLWHGGDKSPVIWISRHLKQQGQPLSKEMVLWIRAHSENRFLPNGPVF